LAKAIQPRKTVLVTGGAKRIGRAIVEGLAGAGFDVAIHANRSIHEAEALAASIRQTGVKAVAIAADLRDSRETARLVAEASDALGGLGAVINSASLFLPDTASDFTDESWNGHFDLHVRAPSIIVREFARLMPKGQSGLVVNIIDQRVWAPKPRFYSYTLSKSALWTATRTMAMELAPAIRVNAIGPGPTMPNERQSEVDFEAQIAALILKRGPDLAEFVRTILYFYQTPSVTGQMIALDGGQHLAWETPDVLGMAE
jgi:NAD(P)-dependent dehydrogenase (short-subunit alcohol dehydrogenase family)